MLTFALSAGCDMTNLAVNTTSGVLARAEPSLEQEADYELAARGIPGTLKTLEGFHMANPENEVITRLLAKGFCQYGTGFIEDEWEIAGLAKDFETQESKAVSATKMYTRCMGYALELLPGSWKKGLTADMTAWKKLVDGLDSDDREPATWLAIGLAGIINFNRDNIGLISHLPRAKLLLERLALMAEKNPPSKKVLAAMPHLALGMLYSAMGAALGGRPDLSKAHFEKALAATDNKFLLAKVLYARKYAVAQQDHELFTKLLREVLATDPAIWPDQRLANEIAHRRAKRYLKFEKEWF